MINVDPEEFDPRNFSDELNTNIKYVALTLLIAVLFIGAGNAMTPEEPPEVGMVEITTECVGIKAGVCIGFEKFDHKTYNFDDWESVEEGDENFYRKVESELMIQAYEICGKEEVSGMEWTEQAEYDNRTGKEWLENDRIELLPCSQTTFHSLED